MRLPPSCTEQRENPRDSMDPKPLLAAPSEVSQRDLGQRAVSLPQTITDTSAIRTADPEEEEKGKEEVQRCPHGPEVHHC